MDDVALPSPKFATVRVRHDACVNRTASHVNWDAAPSFVSRSWITRYRPSTRVASRFFTNGVRFILANSAICFFFVGKKARCLGERRV